MFQVYRHISQLRDHRTFYGWLFRIARIEWLQDRRRTAALPPTVAYEPLADELDSGERPAGEGPFRKWMQYMDETEREILVLRFVEDLDYAEIGEALGVPVGTIKWKVFQAKAKLAAVLGKKLVRSK